MDELFKFWGLVVFLARNKVLVNKKEGWFCHKEESHLRHIERNGFLLQRVVGPKSAAVRKADVSGRENGERNKLCLHRMVSVARIV